MGLSLGEFRLKDFEIATAKLKAALEDLIKRYEAGDRVIHSGLCYELSNVYKLPDSHAESLIDQYPEWLVLKKAWIDTPGVFTTRRYNFCMELLADVLEGKYDKFWEDWYNSCADED